MFHTFVSLRGSPGIVDCNVIDDLNGAHVPVPDLDMGLGVVAGGEVDFGGAFVVEGLLGGMVIQVVIFSVIAQRKNR